MCIRDRRNIFNFKNRIAELKLYVSTYYVGVGILRHGVFCLLQSAARVARIVYFVYILQSEKFAPRGTCGHKMYFLLLQSSPLVAQPSAWGMTLAYHSLYFVHRNLHHQHQHWISLICTGFCWSSLDFVDLHWILLICTGFQLSTLDFTSLMRSALHWVHCQALICTQVDIKPNQHNGVTGGLVLNQIWMLADPSVKAGTDLDKPNQPNSVGLDKDSRITSQSVRPSVQHSSTICQDNTCSCSN